MERATTAEVAGGMQQKVEAEQATGGEGSKRRWCVERAAAATEAVLWNANMT